MVTPGLLFVIIVTGFLFVFAASNFLILRHLYHKREEQRRDLEELRAEKLRFIRARRRERDNDILLMLNNWTLRVKKSKTIEKFNWMKEGF